jgi:membrane-associated phospholipid phosphatase
MPADRTRPLAVVAVLGVLLVAVPGILYAADTQPGRFDRWVRPRITGTDTAVALGIDRIGEPLGRTLVVGALAIACLALGRGRLAVVTLVGTVLTSVVAVGLKPLVDRRIHGEFLSYPSGHTAAVAALGIALGLLLADVLHTTRTAGTLLAVGTGVMTGAVMAWAQVTLDAHHPTDTIGGIGTALAVMPATAIVTERLRRTGGTPA